VIAITHRIATVRRFDRILVIEAGELVEDGSPDELASRSGPYRDLLAAEERLARARAGARHAA
jgi:ATP-binding cassette subfamily B protein